MKRNFIFVLLLSWVSLPIHAENQNLGRIFDLYSTLMGGWFLNEKCDFLSEQLKKDFGLGLKAIQKNLTENGVDRQFLYSLHTGAKEVSNKPPYSQCGQDAQMLVAQLSLKAWNIGTRIAIEAKRQKEANK